MSKLLSSAPIRQRLDVEEGLDRLMGERALYLQILRRFLQDYRNSCERIQSLLTQQQEGKAQLAAHSLKGSAGLIGAQLVHDQAVLVENAIADGVEVAALLSELAVLLREACGSIDDLLLEQGSKAAASDPPAVDPAQLRALIEELVGLLREGDGAAIDLVEKSATILASALGVPTFQMVAAATHAFDFETALDVLEMEL
ncbi:HPt (histidine-containing phosphotransfer) domain-containing protein [Duganella sp. CF458]|uniref:Hpt domain-containing protein n=1 Tax=Duganella sp. CF458 TaxID=1884368 RepID=UPI0008E64528|nr:Hpt domain-containing protein [Duganella sp. CF458]SFH01414.1 HPt (histidine-containing phosphotransfer) domain-containing protein [Duganella sp. CF458]